MKFSIKNITVSVNRNNNKRVSKDGERLLNGAIELKVKHFGEKNPDKRFYVIPGGTVGMFSNLQYVLGHINQAENLGMIPIADWQNFPSTYNEPYDVHGTWNSWNYFFENLSQYDLEEVYQSKNVYFASQDYNWGMGHYFSEDHDFYDIYKRYIQFKPEVLAEVDKYYRELFFNNGIPRRILGIHARGWEMTVAPGHPFPPSVEQLFKYTDEIVEKYSIENIYLVTEEQEYFHAFTKRYGSKILTTPYARTKKGINGYKINPEPRKNNLYLYGREIILGALLLSKCTGLLHCGTNVSTFARFENHGKYEFEYMIFNGVNTTNRILAKYMWPIRKHLPKEHGGLKEKVAITERKIST